MSGSSSDDDLALEPGEFALVIGQQGEHMSVRIASATEIDDEAPELPVPALLVAALAKRLLDDPDFHDEMLDWYDENTSEDEEDEP